MTRNVGAAYQLSRVDTPGCQINGSQSRATNSPQGSMYRLMIDSVCCKLDGAHRNQISPTACHGRSDAMTSLYVTESPSRPKIKPKSVKICFMPGIMKASFSGCNADVITFFVNRRAKMWQMVNSENRVSGSGMLFYPRGRLGDCIAHRKPLKSFRLSGEMAERFKAHAWKACWGASPSRVRIPLSPPDFP